MEDHAMSHDSSRNPLALAMGRFNEVTKAYRIQYHRDMQGEADKMA
jgi:hypothetical protein